ncbi:fungal-specific transcription factor domain-containing protein [Mariannaea sp. PMI_226]|nr:fungal-specific transcription factor domain-containing protein [Mariannaea sp. PMI_226]
MPKRQTKVNSSSSDNHTAYKPRAGANPRSRSGCVTCKAKHTKCDETRPECLRCTRKGIKCGGYWREFKWSFKHQPGTGESTLELPDDATGHAPRRSRQQGSISSELSLQSMGSSGTDEQSIAESLTPIKEDPSLSSLSPIISQSTSILPHPRLATTTTTAVATATSNTACPGRDQDNVPSTLISTDIFTDVPVFMTTPITDTSSLLITNWFEQVCPAWSGFDSPSNLNRKLATELWHESRSVFSSLQSMSAAFLSTRLPHMRQPAVRLMQTATESIQAEVRATKAKMHLDTVPTGLLFSLFCVGTTVCWIDTSQLGLPFFREAKLLLDRLNRRLPAYYEEDVEIIQFFNKCLTYCEMLLAVVSDSSLQAVDPVRPRPERIEESEKRAEIELHPWTGSSTATSRLFTKSIRLCRNFRHKLKQQGQEQTNFQMPLNEIHEAQRLEEQLLELDFPANVQSDTGDQRTPYLHLTKIAEAYQLAALLHLYQTFPELVSFRLPINSTTLYGGNATWEEWIIPLSLRLVRVMEHIPPSSGSRAIQPLLYISASTGLRYDTSAPFDLLDLPWNSGLGTMDEQLRTCYDNVNPLSSPEGMNLPQGTVSALGPSLISQLSLDISNARHFIMGRLSILENSLPPKPVKVAKKLIQAVWDAYDNEMPGCTTVHWVDVMENNNLRTMFG